MADSLSLDEADQKNNPENLIIPTDGGRFDVNIRERKKAPVYWTGDAKSMSCPGMMAMHGGTG